MKFWSWEKGRQGTGYDKMLLAQNSRGFPFDVYLIRYLEGAYVPPHKDPVQQGRHYRLNLILKGANSGGEFLSEKNLFETKRIKFFRPDLSEHSVTPVQGTRYVLSIGWLLP